MPRRKTVPRSLMYSLARSLREITEALITAAVMFVLLQLTTQSYAVQGQSMAPTLESGQRILINRFVYFRDRDMLSQNGYLFGGPQRGEVIVFAPPLDAPTEFVKRVIAVPGDVIDIAEGVVTVNGEVTEYVDAPTYVHSPEYPLTVPQDRYYVLGDNRDRSSDSRQWGLVEGGDIIGRVWFSYWPFDAARLFR